MLDLGGTGYLGLQNDPEWLGLVQKYLQKYGTNHPISRLNQHSDFEILHQVEAYLAMQLGCEAACLFSSGFLSGLAVARFTAEKAFEAQSVLWLPDNHHPCLAPPVGWKALPIDPQHSDSPSINTQAIAFAQTIDPIFGDPDPSIDHSVYREASLRVLDVSHSIGLWNHQPWINSQTLVTGSLGKAWAFPAGFIAGSQKLVTAIQQAGTFCASAPPSIAFASAFLEFSQTRERLQHQLSELLDSINHHWNLPSNPEQLCPIYNLGQHSPALKSTLEGLGYHMSWLQYPTPTSPLYVRQVFKANHSPVAIQALLEWLDHQGLAPQKTPASFEAHYYFPPSP